jgi:hypothetical protein
MTKYCEQCATYYEDKIIFCTHCGTQLGEWVDPNASNLEFDAYADVTEILDGGDGYVQGALQPQVSVCYEAPAVPAPPSTYVAPAAPSTYAAPHAQSSYYAHVDDDSNDETTILSGSEPLVTAVLVEHTTGQEIAINKSPFVLGRKRDKVDFRVGGGTKISRLHAEILRLDGQYFIRDLGAKNKTYLDQLELAPHEAVELWSGAVLKIADVEFDFFIRTHNEAIGSLTF